MDTQTFSYDQLFSFCNAIFIQIGCSNKDADIATKALLSADLRGIDSHGIARLSGYIRLWEAKRIHTKATCCIVHETLSTAVVDGNAGLGLTIAPYAMSIAIQKAKQCGTGWVSVKNSNHFGIAGYHAMLALEHNMIGIAMTNASPLVAPTFSIDRMLGTNPIAVAVPAGTEPPFVADFATTNAANGKLEILQRKKEQAPLGWVQDIEGQPTTDAEILKKGGALLPLGSTPEQSNHKGYALGAIVDILSGVLGGANYGPWVPPFPAFMSLPTNMPGEGIGHFFGAMRIDAFRPAKDFKKDMDNWIQAFRKAKTVKGSSKVLIPGDIERETEQKRMQEGIPLLTVVVEDLQMLADKMNIEFNIKDIIKN